MVVFLLSLKKLEACWTLLFLASIANLVKHGRKELRQWRSTRNEKLQTPVDKSSKKMEAVGAVMLCSCSGEKLGLQYTSFIADGDSATY